MNEQARSILEEIKKVIVGKDEVIAKVLMAMISGGHILLDDVPGVGKTTLALSFSKVLGLDYKRVQLTSDSMPSDIIGFSVYDKVTGNLEYKPGAVMTNLFLADEINRTSSRTQSALLEVMEEQHVTVDGVTHDVPRPFIVIATQNPVGSAGTQMLPDSQLDRFMIRTKMGYPDFQSQVNILKDRHVSDPLDSVTPLLRSEDFLRMGEEVNRVYISDLIYEYVTTLAEATRGHEMVLQGISPRGALALCRMVKAYAFVAGRDYVIPEDVGAVFGDVVGHRLILQPRARLTDTTAADIVAEILEAVPLPVTGRDVAQ
ncbi:MAG: AAA family ATPase [Bacillota bacterium]|jgi:MoxR-like ATPase